MINRTAVCAALILAGCSTKGSFEGRLVDGLSGDPVPDTRLLLKSSDTSDQTCRTFEATTDDAGVFRFEGTCANATYQLELAKEFQHLQVDAEPIPGGETSTGVQDITTWMAPGVGVYYVADGEARLVRTASDLDTVKIWKTDEEVRYPETVPKNIVRVTDGQHLLIAGKANMNKLRFEPLIESEKRRFGSPEHYYDMDAWSYIGVKFESDTKYERVEVKVDEGGITRVQIGEFIAMYVSDKALAPGRYALLGEKDRRTYLVDFGPEAP